MTYHPSPRTRRCALKALVQLNTVHAFPYVLAALKGPDVLVYSTAIDILSQQTIPLGMSLLLATLNDADATVRARMALILGKRGDLQAVDPLLTLLADTDGEVRWRAKAVKPLLAVLDDAEWHVRNGAAHALGMLGERRAPEPLLAAVSR